MISDHPVFGVGANNYVMALPRYLTPDTVGQWIYTVHNQFLLPWAESGPAAFAAVIWLFFEIVVAGIALTRTTTRLLACIGLGVAAAVCGHAAHMTIEIMNGRQQLGMLLVLAAIARAAAALAKARPVRIAR
jgi:O-antigen ligase